MRSIAGYHLGAFGCLETAVPGYGDDILALIRQQADKFSPNRTISTENYMFSG